MSLHILTSESHPDPEPGERPWILRQIRERLPEWRVHGKGWEQYRGGWVLRLCGPDGWFIDLRMGRLVLYGRHVCLLHADRPGSGRLVGPFVGRGWWRRMVERTVELAALEANRG